MWKPATINRPIESITLINRLSNGVAHANVLSVLSIDYCELSIESSTFSN